MRKRAVGAYCLRSRLVYPIDRDPIENGFVSIDGERIGAVGHEEVARGPVHDLGDVALVPGLINAHTHLEFSYLRRPLGTPGMRLVDWIRLVIAERGRGDVCVADAIRDGLRESAASGATSIGDIVTVESEAYQSEQAPDLTLLLEVIGFSRQRAQSALKAAIDRLAVAKAKAPPSAAGERGAQMGISPHAPYTVSPALLSELVAVARCERLPIAMHLAESTDELEFLERGTGPFRDLLEERGMWDVGAIPRGSRPLDYLQQLAEAPRSLVIHGNYLSEKERSYLASRADRMSLVYCPRTHSYFGHPPYPLAEMQRIGVRVAIGTDSRASNPDLAMWQELRHVARIHDAIDPLMLLKMATQNAGEALGIGDRVGTIGPGKFANLAAFPLLANSADGPREQLSALLSGNEAPSGVWLRGQRIVG